MNTCFYGVVLDLELVPVRSAPGKLVTGRTVRTSEVVSVEVLEPEDQPSPRLALPGPSSSCAPYRIPRIPRSVPAPIKRTTHRLSARKAAVLADKEFKRERKRNRKVCPRYKRYCKVCGVSGNSAKAFYDHIQSRSHRIQVANAKETPRCIPCNRVFESHGHLKCHENGAAHLKVVCEQNS